MTDIDALVERLRDERHLMQGDGLSALIATASAAADALTAEREKVAALEAELEAERALSYRLATELGIIDRALACEEADANAEQDMDGNVYAKINVTTFRNTTRAALAAHTAAREEPHDRP